MLVQLRKVAAAEDLLGSPTEVKQWVKAAMGHELDVQGDFSSFVGGGQAVMRHGGVNYGASDPRKDGSAIPEPVTGDRLPSFCGPLL